MTAPDPIKVTVSDPDTGEVLEERTIDNDYILVCAGNRYVAYTKIHTNGTHQLTVRNSDTEQDR